MQLINQHTFTSLRPWSYPASLQAIFIGNSLSYVLHTDIYSIIKLLISILLVISVHTSGNLINTYYDYKLGLDKQSTSADRTLVDKLCTTKQIVVYIYTSYTVSAASVIYFISSCVHSDCVHNIPKLLFLILFGMILSHTYTAPPFMLKYRGFGDIVIFISFGPLLVSTCYFIQTQQLYNIDIILLSVCSGLITNAILHANNTRDIIPDLAGNAVTLPQLVSKSINDIIFITLFIVPYCIQLYLTYKYGSIILLLPFITSLQCINIINRFISQQWNDICPDTGKFVFMFGSLQAISILAAKTTIQNKSHSMNV